MGFNPLAEKGIALEDQVINWKQLNVKPYDKEKVHPYTRTRGILMNGIEVEAVIFMHQMARHTTDAELRQQLAMLRRLEQQQQKMVNWMIPGDESPLAVTIGYEQVAVDLTAWLARTVPDPYVKAALDFALIEDFDHLYRYANLMGRLEDREASDVTRELTEIMPGRPTILEHRHPFDSPRHGYDAKTADILTKMHVQTIICAEQQTMNFYMNIGPTLQDHYGRGLYQEIAQIEEQHVTHYESLADPTMSWFERLVMHQYNECYLYYSCMSHEVDDRVKKHWQHALECEVEHLKFACDLMRQYGKKDPAAMLPEELPQLTLFQSNKEYVRQIIAEQVDLTGYNDQFVNVGELPAGARFHDFQHRVNGDGATVPSQKVIEQHIEKTGRDYRMETEGPHPVERFRSREKVTK